MFFDTASLQSTFLGQFVLPFAIIFAVAYGSLRTADVFKDKNVNALTAAVIAFLSATYAPLVNALWLYFPFIAGLIILLFLYNLVRTILFGKKEKGAANTAAGEAKAGKGGEGDVVFITGAIILLLAISGANFLPELPGLDKTNLLFILALLAVFVIVKKGWGGEGEKTP